MCLLCVTLYNTRSCIVVRPQCCLNFKQFSIEDNTEMWIKWLQRDLTMEEVELIETSSIPSSYIVKPIYEDLLLINNFIPIESTYLYFCIIAHREPECFSVMTDYLRLGLNLTFLNRQSLFSGATLLIFAIRHHVSNFAKSLIDYEVDVTNAIDECLYSRNVIVLQHLLSKGHRPTDISWFDRFAEQPGYDEIRKYL